MIDCFCKSNKTGLDLIFDNKKFLTFFTSQFTSAVIVKYTVGENEIGTPKLPNIF